MNRNHPPPSSSTTSRRGVPSKNKPTVTPRLAQQDKKPPSSSASVATPPFRPKLQESEFRPKLSESALRHQLRDPESTPPPPPSAADNNDDDDDDDDETAANITPRSSSRKSRAEQTPDPPDDKALSHAKKRPLMISPTNAEPVSRRPQSSAATSTKPRSVVGQARPTAGNASRPHAQASTTARPMVRGFVKSTDSAKASTSTFGPHLAAPALKPPASRPGPAKTQSTPMFFHASDAKSQPPAQEKRPPLKKKSSFFYANGQQQEASPKAASLRSPSPAPSSLSVLSDARSPHVALRSPPHVALHSPLPSEPPQSPPPILSPPLSAVSSKSNYFSAPSPLSPSLPPLSPPKNNIHLSYRKGVSQIIGLGGPALPFHRSHVRSNNNSTDSKHAKSSSLSSIDTGSPDVGRRRSFPVPQITTNPPPAYGSPDTTSGQAAVIDAVLDDSINIDSDAPSEHDPSSPIKPPVDLYAEARRARKVLDLEISNSSLLAINKSLEREIRKQKAELKRYRRLSRAGQFAVPPGESPVGELSTLEEEDDLPAFDDRDGARPSSPFLEQTLDDSSDDESNNSSAVPMSPTAQAERDAAQRAEDENSLRLDLSRHRELLMDTQRMNQSLQRCLYWTEGLIKDGKKALEYQVMSSDVQLGGHILSADDLDETLSQAEHAEDSHDFSAEPQTNPRNPNRNSVGSEMDSGIDLGKRPPLLLMAVDNPHRVRTAQQ